MLAAIGEERSLVEAVVKRKKNWIGHIVRGEGLLKLALEGRMEGKRQRGRPRLGMIDEISERRILREYEEESRGIEKVKGLAAKKGPAVRQENS